MFQAITIKNLIKTHPAATGILAVIVVFYTWSSLHVGFLGDDWRYLYEIQKNNNPFDYILHPYTTAFAWRPLADLSWVLNYIASGTNPVGYHLVNLAIFFATLVVLFVILRRILHEHIAIWTTTLFALMPIHNEAIVWLSGRTDSLAVLFFLLSLNSYMLFRTAHHGRTYAHLALSTLFYAASIFSKESVILGPIIFLAYDRIALKKFAGIKHSILIMLPYAACIGALLIMRILVIGGIVSHDPAFTDSYSLIPTPDSIIDTFRAFTFIINRSVATSLVPHFVTAWKYVLLPIASLYIISVTLAQRPWKNSTLRTAMLTYIGVTLSFLAPVFSLMNHITPDLKHMRFLYAPSIGIALLLATILAPYQSRAVRYAQHIGMFGIVSVFAVATILNMQPWAQAATQTQHVLEAFVSQYPDYANTTNQTTVYVLHTPSEYRGAYLFHDYYSLQQAIKQYTRNSNLLVQTVGTKPVFPATLCTETTAKTVHVLSWNGTDFDNQDELIAPWSEHSTPRASFTLNTQAAWDNANMKIRNADYHFANNALVLDNLGEHPQLQISLPEGSYSRDWQTAQLHADAKNPTQLSWNSPKIVTQTFNSLIPETASDNTNIPLCAYPNWVVAGSLRDIELTFAPGDAKQITVTSFELQ